MACGSVVVAADYGGGLRDIITDCEERFLVPAGNVQ
jgi:glycosyltransferase involved in cell wall biosynthesis